LQSQRPMFGVKQTDAKHHKKVSTRTWLCEKKRATSFVGQAKKLRRNSISKWNFSNFQTLQLLILFVGGHWKSRDLSTKLPRILTRKIVWRKKKKNHSEPDCVKFYSTTKLKKKKVHSLGKDISRQNQLGNHKKTQQINRSLQLLNKKKHLISEAEKYFGVLKSCICKKHLNENGENTSWHVFCEIIGKRTCVSKLPPHNKKRQSEIRSREIFRSTQKLRL